MRDDKYIELNGDDLPEELKAALLAKLAKVMGGGATADDAQDSLNKPIKTIPAPADVLAQRAKLDAISKELHDLAERGKKLCEQRENQSTRTFDAIACAFGLDDMDDLHAKGYYVNNDRAKGTIGLHQMASAQEPKRPDGIVLRRGSLNN